jgi:hypothetical protein
VPTCTLSRTTPQTLINTPKKIPEIMILNNSKASETSSDIEKLNKTFKLILPKKKLKARHPVLHYISKS